MRPEIPILSFLSITSLPLPLFYYLRSGNVAMVAHILWLLCLDITYAVDAIVWANNVDKVATVWCDISEYSMFVFSIYKDLSHFILATKLMVGWPTALAATCLAFCMRLAMLVSKADEITPTEAYRRRRHTQYREAALCLGLPLAIMAIRTPPYFLTSHARLTPIGRLRVSVSPFRRHRRLRLSTINVRHVLVNSFHLVPPSSLGTPHHCLRWFVVQPTDVTDFLH